MKQRVLSRELSKLVTEFDQAGGVVDFALFEPPSDGSISLPQHQEAATGTIRAAEEKMHDLQRRQGIKPTLHYKIEPDKMTAHEIGVREFLGPRFDFEMRTLNFVNSSMGEDLFGFAYAFSDPPHGMDSPPRCQELFRIMLDMLFGELSTLKILEWSTDWSNYFEPGKEWWGSFCWTVYAPQREQLVGIAASTTD